MNARLPALTALLPLFCTLPAGAHVAAPHTHLADGSVLYTVAAIAGLAAGLLAVWLMVRHSRSRRGAAAGSARSTSAAARADLH